MSACLNCGHDNAHLNHYHGETYSHCIDCECQNYVPNPPSPKWIAKPDRVGVWLPFGVKDRMYRMPSVIYELHIEHWQFDPAVVWFRVGDVPAPPSRTDAEILAEVRELINSGDAHMDVSAAAKVLGKVAALVFP